MTATASRRSSPTSPNENIAIIECRHRQRAHVEDRIRDDKDTGLAKFPFKAFALNEVWLEIVMLAHDLIVWTQALLLDGELAKAEPKPSRSSNSSPPSSVEREPAGGGEQLLGPWPVVLEAELATTCSSR